MRSYLHTSKKRNLLILTIMITLVFVVINLSLLYLNDQFVAEKIEEENQAFTTLTMHLINENDVSVAVEYMEHYSHTHTVEIALVNGSGEILFTTKEDHDFTLNYPINTLQGNFQIFIDNTGGTTLDWASSQLITMNISLVIIYVLSVIIFLWVGRDASKKINEDIDLVLDMIHHDRVKEPPHNYQEFYEMYEYIREYLEEIDLLREQKNMNIKGLVHDIKTPMTMLRHFVDQQRNHPDKEQAIQSLKSMNDIVQDLMSDDYHKSLRKLDVEKSLKDLVNRYKGVFSTKNIELVLDIQTKEEIRWNQRDFNRVLENLLSNAYYYSYPDTVVNIKVLKKEHVEIELWNKGDLLSKEERSKVFEKGFRRELSKKVNASGQGLGLYSTRLLLKLIGAKIDLRVEEEWVVVRIVF